MIGDTELHAGYPITVIIDGQAIPTRIEYMADSTHSFGWYLVDRPDQVLDGLAATLD